MQIDWKRKLSSRKFWAAIVAYLTSILTAFAVGDNTIAQITAIITGVGALVVYMLAEAKVDAKPGDTYIFEDTDSIDTIDK